MNEEKKTIILSAIFIGCLIIAFILNRPAEIENLNSFNDWETIQKRTYIRAGVLQNTTDYYLENGTVKGFHYDLLELFSNHYKIDVHYSVYNTYWDNFWALMTGEIDVLSMDLNNDPMYNSFFLFTNPHSYSHKVFLRDDTVSLHWAVNKQNRSLHKALNTWIDSLKDTRHYNILLEKYYSPTSKNRITIAEYQRKHSNMPISAYDDLIKKYAKRFDFDWRLIAAIIYRESKFNPHAVGQGGAYGLMQIMPQTAIRLGMKNPYSVESQVLYGCKYLNKLKQRYIKKEVDTADLYKFILGAYNAGPCHIDDAILLAEKKGYNPKRWADVEKMLLKLSDKKYTKNIPVSCGIYKGKHTKKYVNKVWVTYRHYMNMVE